jgi:YacP-like NYN domain
VTITGAAAQPADEPSVLRPVTDLPVAVRQRVVEWAAEALGAATSAEIPPALTRFARFAPQKRARLAANALAQAVQTDAAFRAMVAARAGRTAAATDSAPGLAADEADQNALDPIGAAARAYLLRQPAEDELLRAVADAARESDARARVAELEREVRSLTAKLERVAAELAATKAGSVVSRIDAGGDAERYRLRLREQGIRIRELQQRLDTGTARTAELVAGAEAERDRAKTEAAAWRQRAEAASARADTATEGLLRMRASVGDSRAASDRRLELLLGALEGAAFGLRREWDVMGGGPAPADVVAARLPRPVMDAERTTDPTRLTAWAGLPGAHLIVDGYNVTKTGFSDLSLSDQRDRLVRSLGAFAARTSAEVTVVFDGAAVATARPPARGIRVLFSPPGVVADDVIRDLVRAEPLGRVLIVVSSDREVVDRAAADGARTAASVTLLAALGG